MSLNLTLNFKGGQVWTADAKHRLGIVGLEPDGARWTYVQLAEDVGVGEVVRDSHGADLLSAAQGTVTEGQLVDETRLVDSGEFASADDGLLVGALGQVYGHAKGQGQAFRVKRVVSEDALEIGLLMGLEGAADGGWEVALTTSSKYSLWFPGLVRKSTGGAGDLIRGIAQSAGKKFEYGWVKQSRFAWAKLDVSATAITRGEGVVATGAGLVCGYDDSVSDDDAVNHHPTRVIGRAPFGDFAGNTDLLMVGSFNIVNDALSYRFPDDTHRLNEVTI